VNITVIVVSISTGSPFKKVVEERQFFTAARAADALQAAQ
jgi:hypothetical protein